MVGPLQRRKASYYFALIDEDDNGYVEANDFQLRADRLAETRNVTDPDAQTALRRRVMKWWDHLSALVDVDDDHRVTTKEWQDYWVALQDGVDQGGEAKADVLRGLKQAARATFRAMNTTDGDEITEDEYTDWLVAWGVDENNASFDRLDRDNSGGLTEDDLIQAVKEFYLSNDPEAPGNVLYGELPDTD